MSDTTHNQSTEDVPRRFAIGQSVRYYPLQGQSVDATVCTHTAKRIGIKIKGEDGRYVRYAHVKETSLSDVNG